MKTASYRNISFVEIIADIRGRVVFEIKRDYAGILRRIQFYVFNLFQTVEKFACKIARIKADFRKILIRPFRACAKSYNAGAVQRSRFVRLRRSGRLRKAFAVSSRTAETDGEYLVIGVVNQKSRSLRSV